jgi:hypothetical protein
MMLQAAAAEAEAAATNINKFIAGDTNVADDVVTFPGQTTDTITAVATWSDGATRDDPVTFTASDPNGAATLTVTGPTTCTLVGTDKLDGSTNNVIVTATDAFGFTATHSVDFVSSGGTTQPTVTGLALSGTVS